MKEFIRKIFILSIFSSVILIVLGLFLFLRPATTLSMISYTIGGIIFIIGIFALARYSKDAKNSFELFSGILSIIAGLVIVLNPTALVSIVPIILGIWFIINSSIKIQYAVALKEFGGRKWKYALVFSILTLICGIVLLFNPFKGAVAITQAIGILIITYATIDLIESFLLKGPKTKNKDIIVYDKKV